jgi:hypothetical protein
MYAVASSLTEASMDTTHISSSMSRTKYPNYYRISNLIHQTRDRLPIDGLFTTIKASGSGARTIGCHPDSSAGSAPCGVSSDGLLILSFLGGRFDLILRLL